MHSEFLPTELVGKVSTFDPGMVEQDVEGGFRPGNLPLDSKTAHTLIDDCIRFGEQFKDPSEMAYFGVMSTEEFYEGSSLSIRAQLTRQFDDGKGTKAAREEKEALSKAQFILLLAWFFEERMIELKKLERGIKDSWKSIDTTLGIEDEDRVNGRVLELSATESHTGGQSDEQRVRLPWHQIIEALPLFLPAEAILFCTEQEIYAHWRELEIDFSPAPKGMELPEGAQIASQPVWRFAGRRKQPSTPSLLSEVTVAIME